MPPRSCEPAATSEDDLKQLIYYDVVVLIDDSGSMYGSLWDQARDVMIGVVERAVQYDEDGIEVQFLNSRKQKTVKSEEDVRDLFKKVGPTSWTPLGKRLGDICNKHLSDLRFPWRKPKRCLLIAITDGMPDDKDVVFATIKKTAKRLDELGAPLSQLGIQFVQIGGDAEATKFLKELDDNLKGEEEGQVRRDIVDTVPYKGKALTSEELVKILIGAINRKVDKRA